MIVDFAELPATARYSWMTQAVIPRPVAWTLSENEDGSHNLAPFSYFNALCSAPPLVGLSVGVKADGGDKDTLVNIRRRKFFVVHIATMRLLPDMNESSAELPYGESELSRLNLQTAPLAEDFPLPRLADAPLAFACRLHRELSLGEGQVLLLGEVLYLHADDAVVSTDAKGRLRIDAAKVDPPARLGAAYYAGLSAPVLLSRPKGGG